MKIRTQLTYEQYKEVSRKLILGRINRIAIIGFILVIVMQLNSFYLERKVERAGIALLIGGIIWVVVVYYASNKAIRKAYNSNPRLAETIYYEFEGSKMKATGDSFSSESDLAKTHKIVELKEWFLIYQNNVTANFIPKQVMLPGEVDELRALLKNIPNVPYTVKGFKA